MMVRKNPKQDCNLLKWTLLFKKLRFFPRYDHFIQVDVLSQDSTEHNKWLKNVETKLQKLADAIYKQLSDNLQELRINTRPFTREETHDQSTAGFKFCQTFFIGFKFNRSEQGSFDLREKIYSFCLQLDIFRINKQDNNLRIVHRTRNQLSPALFFF